MTSTTKSGFRRRLAAGFLASTAVFALAACSSGGTPTPSDSSAAAAGDEAQQGGTATIISAAPVQSWDPFVAVLPTIPGIGTDGLYAVYGVLLYVDSKGAVQGSLADSLTSDDDTVWTLKLNKGIKFSDGTPLDAAAVKFEWDRAAGEGSALKGTASSFTSEVVDDTTLSITLAKANPVFDRLVAESLQFIPSPKALQEQGANYVKPVGAGPFVLEAWDQAVGETFSRNPDYFQKGKPYLDELKLSVITDPAQRVSTVVQGGGDIMNNYRFALLESLDQPGMKVTEVKTGGQRQIIFNTQKAPFNDVSARQAVALAVDPTDLTQTLTQDPDDSGWTGLFPESSANYDKKYDAKANDPAAAKKLVAKLKDSGADLSVSIVAAAVPELVRAAELLQIELTDVGFDATVEQVPLPDWAPRARAQHDFDITFYPGIYDLNNAPVAMTNLFEGSENIAQFSSPEMSTALESARGAKDEAAQAKAFANVQKIYQEQLPFFVFGIDERVFFHNDKVDGFTPIGRGMLLTEDLHRTDLK
jgi:peptide/nickel transport system substrate-binding protein